MAPRSSGFCSAELRPVRGRIVEFLGGRRESPPLPGQRIDIGAFGAQRTDAQHPARHGDPDDLSEAPHDQAGQEGVKSLPLLEPDVANGVTFVIHGEGAAPAHAPAGAILITSPTRRGLMLMRSLINDDARAGEIDAARRKTTCITGGTR